LLPALTPPGLRDLLRRCLQKDVSRRLRDMGDARLQLEEALPAVEEPVVRVGRNRRNRGREAFVALVLLALTALATYLVVLRREPVTPVFRQLTFRHGAITGARLAADGQTVVYRATWSSGVPELFLVRPENRESGSTGLVNAGIYAVSSRGELAVALGCRLNWCECLGTLAQVPITGGPPRELMKDVLGADWSPDGENLAVVSFRDSSYQLEYGHDTVEIHSDAIARGQRVLVVDDLLATGGTIKASIDLVKRLGAEIVGVAFLIELTDLCGRKALADYDVQSLIQYDI
jgi:hypothetical protein